VVTLVHQPHLVDGLYADHHGGAQRVIDREGLVPVVEAASVAPVEWRAVEALWEWKQLESQLGQPWKSKRAVL
jgi:hypothetical protein